MKRIRLINFIFTCVVGLIFFDACNALSSLIHDGEVVAKVGSHKLYRSDLQEVLPSGLNNVDSTRLSMQYINSWASDQLFVDIAEEQLSKSEKDVSRELELYKQSLLKYRYEQRYVNERLDTSVTMDQIREYYETHEDKFILESPIMKVRFMRIMQDSPNLVRIKRKMSSDKPEDLHQADSLAYSSALKYTDYNNSWLDAGTLATEFGVNYALLLSSIKNSFIQLPGDSGNMNIAYIIEMMQPGQKAPIEFCSNKIKDIILSTRKHKLVGDLERDLLNNAKEKGNFVIIQK